MGIISKSSDSPIFYKTVNRNLIRNFWMRKLFITDAVSTNWHHDCTDYRRLFTSSLSREMEVAITYIRMNIRCLEATYNEKTRICTFCGNDYNSCHYFLCPYGQDARNAVGLSHPPLQ